jgi:hypothetical protein
MVARRATRRARAAEASSRFRCRRENCHPGEASLAWCAVVPSIRAIESAFSHDIVDLTHEANGRKTSLSAGIVDICN